MSSKFNDHFRLHLNNGISTVVIMGALLLTPAAAHAQSDASAAPQATEAQAPQTEGDIVVTANRREERLQRVPISVAAISPSQMAQANITRPEELQKLVPGLTAIPNAGTASTSYNIRGVGQSDYGAHQEQPVAVYQDGIYIASSAAGGFPIYDIARSEVLRGPQGTLFGRNSTGGLIQFISAEPVEGVSGALSGGVGSRDLRRIQGYVNLGDDLLAARISGYHLRQDGYIKNDLGADLLSQNISAMRVQLKFTPTDTTTFKLRAEGWNATGTSSAGKALPSYNTADGYSHPLPATLDAYGTGAGLDLYGFRDSSDPYHISVNDPGLIRKRVRSGAFYITQELGDVTLSSTSGYVHTNITYREDTDSSPLNVIQYGDHSTSDEFTQELRLEGKGDRFRWTAGAFYFSVKGNYSAYYNLPTICDPTNDTTCIYAGTLPLSDLTARGAASSEAYMLHTQSFAGFAQGEYDITPELTAVIGGRYSYDKQKFDYVFGCTETLANACSAIFAVGKNPGTVSGLGPISVRQHTGDWSGKIGLNYKATGNIMFYASLSKGLKGGGFAAPLDGQLPLSQLSFNPEKLYAYEGGAKTSWFNNKLTANLAAYYYDYRSFQTYQFSGVSSSVLNRNAHSHGGELELMARPLHGLTANLGIAYNNMWVNGINTPAGVQKQRAINAPKWQINWGVTKSVELTDDVTVSAGYNGRYTSSRYFNIVNLDTVYTPGFVLHDANVGLTYKGFSLDAFVTNFTNKAYANSRFDQTAQGFYLSHMGEPRTWGLNAGYKF